jgi:acyl-CoA thioester hydrolase
MTLVHELRVTVGSSDCDVLGHMNVARYFALCNQCGSALQAAIGWVPGQERDGSRLSFAVVRSESDFKSEVMEGEMLTVRSDLLRLGNKSASFRNRIARADGTEVFHSVWHTVCLNLETRRAAPIPPALRTALTAFLLPGSTD